MKKLFIMLMFSILLLGMLTAQGCADEGYKGSSKVNIDKTVVITCSTCTFINFSLTSPTGNIIIFNDAMTKNGAIFSYTFNNTILNTSGTYLGNGYSNLDVALAFCLDTSPNGEILTIPTVIMYFGIISFLILLLIIGIWGVYNSEDISWFTGYLSLIYIVLFSVFFLLWLFSFNYAWNVPILASIFWIIWLFFAFGFLPFIITISFYLILKGFNKKTLESFTDMGYSKDEANSLMKK